MIPKGVKPLSGNSTLYFLDLETNSDRLPSPSQIVFRIGAIAQRQEHQNVHFQA